ncbi:hypothetical protein [Microcoleus sp. LEGE 07076]|uniref:hypothetical protein n=1 Tax=Microcoleus sp. LEGE 07076 TaxID=915322 RepID=UPI0018821F14|nr:hypothetical protein [Microcoleus sp. LEGE 07076]
MVEQFHVWARSNPPRLVFNLDRSGAIELPPDDSPDWGRVGKWGRKHFYKNPLKTLRL